MQLAQGIVIVAIVTEMFFIPAWHTRAYVRVANKLRAITDNGAHSTAARWPWFVRYIPFIGSYKVEALVKAGFMNNLRCWLEGVRSTTAIRLGLTLFVAERFFGALLGDRPITNLILVACLTIVVVVMRFEEHRICVHLLVPLGVIAFLGLPLAIGFAITHPSVLVHHELWDLPFLFGMTMCAVTAVVGILPWPKSRGQEVWRLTLERWFGKRGRWFAESFSGAMTIVFVVTIGLWVVRFY
ncbi:MAG TPA: hypothetical protein VLG40_05385 [Candidatus Saccharimonas sp.]|nr:hypothetical protein [Candidatus Saccharimonas sp.]